MPVVWAVTPAVSVVTPRDASTALTGGSEGLGDTEGGGTTGVSLEEMTTGSIIPTTMDKPRSITGVMDKPLGVMDKPLGVMDKPRGGVKLLVTVITLGICNFTHALISLIVTARDWLHQGYIMF